MRKLLAKWFSRKEKPEPTPTPTAFKYHWMQLKTHHRGVKTVECNTRQEFLELLAKWNRLDPDRWKYWEA